MNPLDFILLLTALAISFFLIVKIGVPLERWISALRPSKFVARALRGKASRYD